MSTSTLDATDQKRATILIVEDDLAMREFMKTCLEIEGYDVITAADGQDGLQRYKENRDQVEVVVTDLEMPTMNGSDMIRHIFEITPAMKVVVASGERAACGEQVASCLQKPYTAR